MIDGVLLLDKPAGPTSNHILRPVRRWAGIRKAGHTGTLDPLATGLLPVLLGRATRLAPFLPCEPKRYRAVVRFGITTDTGDSDGQVMVHRDAGSICPAEWTSLLNEHRGAIELPVPAYAAVKVGGRPLYSYQHRGQTVDLPHRIMRVFELESRTDGWPWVELDLSCGTGTYVRSIAESLGRATGLGAHVVSLRRTAIADWTVDHAVRPDELVSGEIPERAFIPIHSALNVTALTVSREDVSRVAVGRSPEHVRVQSPTGLEPGERFMFTDTTGRLLAVARSRDAWSPSKQPPGFDYERVLVEPA